MRQIQLKIESKFYLWFETNTIQYLRPIQSEFEEVDCEDSENVGESLGRVEIGGFSGWNRGFPVHDDCFPNCEASGTARTNSFGLIIIKADTAFFNNHFWTTLKRACVKFTITLFHASRRSICITWSPISYCWARLDICVGICIGIGPMQIQILIQYYWVVAFVKLMVFSIGIAIGGEYYMRQKGYFRLLKALNLI